MGGSRAYLVGFVFCWVGVCVCQVFLLSEVALGCNVELHGEGADGV